MNRVPVDARRQDWPRLVKNALDATGKDATALTVRVTTLEAKAVSRASLWFFA